MHVPFSASKIGLILSCWGFSASELEAVFSFKMLLDAGILKKNPTYRDYKYGL